MSNNRITPLQILDPKYWSGLTREQHLAWAYGKSPIYIDKTLEKIYEVNYGDDNLVSFVNKFPVKELEADEPYRWRLMGAEERNIPLAKAALTSSGSQVAATDKAGLARGVFFMWFPERYFEVTTHLAGENPEVYQVAVIEDPVQDGTLWRYKVQNFTADDAAFIPYDELAVDTRWKELFGQTEQELSERGNGVHHASHFEMENTLSMIRKNYDVPGNMIGAQNPAMGMQFMGDDGKVYTRWIDKLGWDFYKQFRRDKARLLMYGKSNKMPDGSFGHKGESGNTVRSGFGLYEQMESGNLLFYNTFSLDILSSFAMQLSVGKIKEDKRDFVLSTGEFGAMEFHKAAKGTASDISWLRSDHNFVNGGQGLDEVQITSYTFVNGIKFHVIIDPMKDSPVLNTLKYKEGLASSYTYDIWDFGTTNGEPNIQRVALKGIHEVHRYIPGLRDPFTPGGMGYAGDNGSPTMTSSPKDGYSVYKAAWLGIMIRNVKRTGRLIPSVLR